MRIALINSNRKNRLYPISLLKLGAWLKSEGNDCQLFENKLPKAGEFDEIWITTVFTFDAYYAKAMIEQALNRTQKVVVGGVSASLLPEFFEKTGCSVYKGLHCKAESFSPDYSLLGDVPEYSITHTSRGCVRKCKFCMVPKLEPNFFPRKWVDDISPKSKTVLFYDNNWLAKNKDELFQDIDILHKLVKDGRINKIDFNQGLDARLMTEEIADKLKGLPFETIRFAFDGMHEDGYFQDAVRMMAVRGFKTFMNYVLYNFNDTPEDVYYRLKQMVYLSVETGTGVSAFPMRYQPIMDIDNARGHVGKHWRKEWRSAFMNIRSKQSCSGQVSCKTIAEFEYWFGKDEKEFVKLLSYPDINALSKKKQAHIRLHPEVRHV